MIFRDGVSEGQFNKIIDLEISAIENACKSLKLKVGITFLVVQKRHHTRFFPSKNGQTYDYDRNGNVKAGTVVDTDITHPTGIEFYLASHAAIKVFNSMCFFLNIDT